MVDELANYDCLVLSGGGAKGSYGAGVGKAISLYREVKGLTNPVCYVGASAGALNAYMLASHGPDELIRFWCDATRRSVLSAKSGGLRPATIWRLIKNRANKSTPFSVYDNRGLRAVVEKAADIEKIHSPLIVAATDYTEGTAKAFYSSPLVSKFVAHDNEAKAHQRRLAHLQPIDSTEHLVEVLLASAAIPVVFPPIKVPSAGEDLDSSNTFIDGGIGNNTPTREAAYFFRFLEKLSMGTCGELFCVRQDVPHRIVEGADNFSPVTMLIRTLDIYNAILTSSVVAAWSRINREVEESQERYAEFVRWLAELDLSENAQKAIASKVGEEFGVIGGHTKRVSSPIFEIQPSVDLGDMLSFNPERARANIRHGYNDTLKMLLSKGKLDEAEYRDLINRRLMPD